MLRFGFLILLMPLLLGGCATPPHGSVANGECKVFQAPKFAVLGATQYDQDWADSTIEGGVGACGWRRPAPRPASLSTAGAHKKVSPMPQAKKRGLLRRIRDRLKRFHAQPQEEPAASIEPAEPAPEPPKTPPPAEAVAAPDPLPPAKPVKRSRLEELLHPGSPPK